MLTVCTAVKNLTNEEVISQNYTIQAHVLGFWDTETIIYLAEIFISRLFITQISKKIKHLNMKGAHSLSEV
jgi:hypothetical protein